MQILILVIITSYLSNVKVICYR